MTTISKREQRERRGRRIRARVEGTTARPRLVLHRSLRYLFAQVIDDSTQKTVASLHTKTATLSGDAGERTGRIATAYLAGKAVAEAAKAAGVTTVVFDRAGYAYHGRIAAFADGARDGGLIF